MVELSGIENGKYKPIIERPHPTGEGIQKIYRFSNDYGASVVRFKMLLSEGYGSYTSDETEWELAVIYFRSERQTDFCLAYDTAIANDVIGHLSGDAIEKTLKRIAELPQRNKN